MVHKISFTQQILFPTRVEVKAAIDATRYYIGHFFLSSATRRLTQLKGETNLLRLLILLILWYYFKFARTGKIWQSLFYLCFCCWKQLLPKYQRPFKTYRRSSTCRIVSQRMWTSAFPGQVDSDVTNGMLIHQKTTYKSSCSKIMSCLLMMSLKRGGIIQILWLFIHYLHIED